MQNIFFSQNNASSTKYKNIQIIEPLWIDIDSSILWKVNQTNFLIQMNNKRTNIKFEVIITLKILSQTFS